MQNFLKSVLKNTFNNFEILFLDLCDFKEDHADFNTSIIYTKKKIAYLCRLAN